MAIAVLTSNESHMWPASGSEISSCSTSERTVPITDAVCAFRRGGKCLANVSRCSLSSGNTNKHGFFSFTDSVTVEPYVIHFLPLLN